MAQQMQDYVESRRIARMSHEPSEGPDAMVAKTFLPVSGVKPPPASPFPALRPNTHEDRQQQTQNALYGPAAAAAIAQHNYQQQMEQRRRAQGGLGTPASGGLNVSGLGSAAVSRTGARSATPSYVAAGSSSPSRAGGNALFASTLTRPHIATPVTAASSPSRGHNNNSINNNNSSGGGPSVVTPIPTATAHLRERVVLPPPTSRWYPQPSEAVKPLMGAPVDPNVPSSVENSRAARRAAQRAHIASEVHSHFLVNPPPGVGGKKRRSTAGGGGGNSRGNSARASISPPRPPTGGAAGGGGGSATKRKKGVLQCASAIPSTTDAIAAAVKTSAEAASNGQPYVPNNLTSLMAVIRSFADDGGRLSPVAFTKALKDLGVSDASTCDNIFRRLESRSAPGYVHYGTAVAALSAVLNGADTQPLLVAACFSLFDRDGRGYVHRSHLEELKYMRTTLDGHPMCTPFMVKVLTDLFRETRAREEEHYVLMVIRKGKKSSKKKPPPLKTHQNSVIPVGRQVVQHIDMTLFASYFAAHRELALAFAPRWIPLIDTNDAVGVAASEAAMRYENPPSPREGEVEGGGGIGGGGGEEVAASTSPSPTAAANSEVFRPTASAEADSGAAVAPATPTTPGAP